MYRPLKKSYTEDMNDLIEDLNKGGEGSRGGNVMGHTRSGKPIYDKAGHASHSKFNTEDHRDALAFHLHTHTTSKKSGNTKQSDKSLKEAKKHLNKVPKNTPDLETATGGGPSPLDHVMGQHRKKRMKLFETALKISQKQKK